MRVLLAALLGRRLEFEGTFKSFGQQGGVLLFHDISHHGTFMADYLWVKKFEHPWMFKDRRYRFRATVVEYERLDHSVDYSLNDLVLLPMV